MKRINIKKQDGSIGWSAEMQDPTQWIASCVASNAWGLPDRQEVDAEGNPTGVIIPAEYTVEILDITTEHELAECLRKRRQEYPTAEEFMEVWFDKGQAGLNELAAKRTAVKAKYPKP